METGLALAEPGLGLVTVSGKVPGLGAAICGDELGAGDVGGGDECAVPADLRAVDKLRSLHVNGGHAFGEFGRSDRAEDGDGVPNLDGRPIPERPKETWLKWP